MKISESKPIVSVAVLSYNRAQYIVESVLSILRQSYTEFKLTVYDNASTDNTVQLLKEIDDPRLIIVTHPVNIGAVGNMNYALAHCVSDYLIITHDDDRMKPQLLETYIGILNRNDDVNMICCNADLIGGAGELLIPAYLSRRFPGLKSKVTTNGGLAADYVSGLNYVICPTVLLNVDRTREGRNQFREDVGPATDSFFWCEFSYQPGQFLYLEESLFEYRQHQAQDSAVRAALLITQLRTPLYRFLRNKDPRLASRWRKNSIPSVVKECLDRNPTEERRPWRLAMHQSRCLWRLDALSGAERLLAIADLIPNSIVDTGRYWKRFFWDRR